MRFVEISQRKGKVKICKKRLPTHLFQCIYFCLFAPVGHMPFDIAGIGFGSTKGHPSLDDNEAKAILVNYTTVSNAKLNIWQFMYKSFFSCEFLSHGFGLGLLGCRVGVQQRCTAHAANCAARQYLFGFDETMPLATNHKFSSTQSQRLIYHITEMISEREMPW